ncbi:MAG: hypothetical protein PHY15_06495 [Eubacteriales bacterium]|nr:hypothetical protein [Eubacteriales bacterium]
MLKRIKNVVKKTKEKFASKSGLEAINIVIGVAIGLFAAALLIGWLGGSLPDILDSFQDKIMDFFN